MYLSIEDVKETLKQKGIRKSKKRSVIMDVFFKSKEHLTIEELLKKVKKIDPSIGYVTVYRALKLLKDLGFAEQMQIGDGFSRFEKAGDHHDHLICLKCAEIIEFEEKKIEELQEKVALKYHFKIQKHIHEIYGYCQKCS